MTKSSSRILEFRPPRGLPPNTAEGWCARLHADDVTEEDRLAFEKWLNASPDRRAEYELSALTFEVARGLAYAPDLRASFSELFSSGLSRKTQDRNRKSSAAPRRGLGAAAAILAAGVAAWLIYGMNRSDYSTDVGEQKLVSLSDGTTVQLNTASAIKINLDARQRQVTLNRGEAFFNVTQDPSRPFTVKAGTGEIRVLGTKFNVRLEGDGAAVSVLEGRVKIDEVELTTGESANLISATVVAKLPKVQASHPASWREGRLYFDHDPLSKVLQEVNRYTETQFVVVEPETGALRLSGVFRTGDVDSVVFALRETYGLDAEPVGNHIRVRLQADKRRDASLQIPPLIDLK